MRRVLLPLVLLTLAFAPAPLARKAKPPTASQRLHDVMRRLKDMGVEWELAYNEFGRAVRFRANFPGGSISGTHGIGDEGLESTLLGVEQNVRLAEARVRRRFR